VRESAPKVFNGKYSSSKRQPAGAGAAAADPVVEAIKRGGVDAAAAERLMRSVPGLTVAIVEQLASRAKRGKNPPGLLIRKIEADAPQMIAERAEAAERERRRRAQLNAESERVAKERYKVNGTVIDGYTAGLTDDQLRTELARVFRKDPGGVPSIEQARAQAGWFIRMRLHQKRPMEAVSRAG
jgi:hypothetical protein